MHLIKGFKIPHNPDICACPKKDICNLTPMPETAEGLRLELKPRCSLAPEANIQQSH